MLGALAGFRLIDIYTLYVSGQCIGVYMNYHFSLLFKMSFVLAMVAYVVPLQSSVDMQICAYLVSNFKLYLD